MKRKPQDLAKTAASPQGVAAGAKLDKFFDAQDKFFKASLDPSMSSEERDRLRSEAVKAEEVAKESFFGFMRELGLCDFEDSLDCEDEPERPSR